MEKAIHLAVADPLAEVELRLVCCVQNEFGRHAGEHAAPMSLAVRDSIRRDVCDKTFAALDDKSNQLLAEDCCSSHCLQLEHVRQEHDDTNFDKLSLGLVLLSCFKKQSADC